MGAAMQNGVGGHAGVFATATDVAKINANVYSRWELWLVRNT